jgi:hypothetical protein
MTAIAPPPTDLRTITPSLARMDGGIKVGIASASPGIYRLERSTDLKTWESAGEIQLSATGPLEFTDPSPPAAPVFYRIALDPPGVPSAATE